MSILPRIAFQGLLVLLTVFASRDAALAYWRTQEPESVPAFFADDFHIRSMQLDRALSRQSEQIETMTSEIGPVAGAVLANDPLDARAMWRLGLVAAFETPREGASRFTFAERITRRNLPAQIALINHASLAGDVASSIAHYNRALSVDPGLGEKLYPVLGQALVEPAIRRELGRYADRPWFTGFLGNAVNRGADPGSAVAMFVIASPRLMEGEARKLVTALVGQLIGREQFGLVRGLAAHAPALDAAIRGEIGISAETSDPAFAPLIWRFANDDAVEALPGRSGSLDVRVAPERSGQVAERMTLLAPGQYTFKHDMHYAPGAAHARLSWDVRCLGGAEPATIWQQSWPAESGSRQFQAAFTVPAGCEAQTWRISASAELSQVSSTAQLTSMALIGQ